MSSERTLRWTDQMALNAASAESFCHRNVFTIKKSCSHGDVQSAIPLG